MPHHSIFDIGHIAEASKADMVLIPAKIHESGVLNVPSSMATTATKIIKWFNPNRGFCQGIASPTFQTTSRKVLSAAAIEAADFQRSFGCFSRALRSTRSSPSGRSGRWARRGTAGCSRIML